MKQFIILTAITDEKVIIRISDIIYVEEYNRESKIIVKTTNESWNISAKKHTVESILKEIETP